MKTINLIRAFQESADGLRDQIEMLKSGKMRVYENNIDTTDKAIRRHQNGVDQYEKAIEYLRAHGYAEPEE